MMLLGMGIDDSFKGILDFSRLMEGENRKSEDPEDIAHWKAVYSDLVAFKQKMLDETSHHIVAVPATEPELGKNDLPFLRAEMQRLQRGLEFWEGRSNKTTS